MADRQSRKLRRLAQAARREAALARAAVRAYNRLFKALDPLLRQHSYDTSVLDDRLPAWRDAVDEELAPEVTATYIAALEADAREGVTVDAQAYATRYLSTVHNRLVGVSDYVFDQIAATLAEGTAKGEPIPELAARVDALFTDTQRWRGRATVVARTEVVGANNAGQDAAARASATQLDVDYALVVKEWLATPDTRTRHTHRDADGQQVLGLDTRFSVGLAKLARPGDAAGPPEEVIQCRCSALYHFPGDLDYPDDTSSLTAGGTMPDFDQLARLFDVSRMPPKLQAYWLGPEGAAKIGYGTPGQFARCQAALKGKVPGHMIDGTCANLIHKATGEWPGHSKAAGTTDTYEPELLSWDLAMAYYVVGSVTSPLHLAAAADAENPMVEPPAGAIPADAAPAYDPDEEEHDSDSVWVALLPTDTDTVQGIGPEHPKHCTVLFLGTTEQMDDPELLAQAVATKAAATQPLTVEVTKLDRLGRDPAVQALVWMLATDELRALRSDLIDTDTELQGYLDKADQFPEYLPHVTVGWPDDQTDDTEDSAWAAIEAAAADVATVTFDRLAVWHGTDRTEYPLGDTPMPDAPTQQEDDAAMTAAATEVSTEAQTDTTLTWAGVLCPEGIKTGDKRKFAEGAILWMEDPGVLKAMFADKPGHDDSVPVGVIRSIERVDGKLPFNGEWSTGAEAEKARQWNIDGRLRGVSVDLDDVEMHLEDDDGNVLEGDAIWELDVEPTLVVDKARVRAATLWCTPAYVEAYVLDATVADQVPKTNIVDATGVTPLGLAAAAAYRDAGTDLQAAADALPSTVFANPGLTEPTPMTVTDDGRVFGHLATWGTCHIGIDGACVTPPTSEADYAYFATGMYACSDGEVVPVGQITMGTGHADLALGWRPTVDHYDDTGTTAAYISVGEDPIGIWFAGALRPGLPKEQALALQRTGSVSGDWRDWGRGLELVAALAVNVPGFPIPRVASRVASVAAAGGRAVMRPVALVASGVVAHDQAAAVRLPSVAELAREVVAYQARQARKDTLVRRVRKSRQQQLAGRIRKG